MKDIHKDIFIFEQKWELVIHITTSQKGRTGMTFHLRKYPLLGKLGHKSSEIWIALTNNRKILKFYSHYFDVKGYRDAKIKFIKLLTDNYEKVISHNS